jgi:hypothetical protein
MFPVPRASNLVRVLGIIEMSQEEYIVLAEERGPSKIVCWRMDRDGNCYWGRYGSEACPAFIERFNRAYPEEEES